MEYDKKIILFDGVCNLCNSAVIFIIERDINDQFCFAALQSGIGEELMKKHDIETDKVDTIILIDDNRYYLKSSAALRIARQLSGGYPLLYGFIILPKVFRDWIYNVTAKNRYTWLGKNDRCMVPTPELLKKFLHD